MWRRADRKIRSHHWHRDTWRKWLLWRKSPQPTATVNESGSTLLGHTKPVIFVRVLSVRHTNRSGRLEGSTAEIGRYIEDTTDPSSDQCVSVHHYCVHLVPRSRRNPSSVKHSNDTTSKTYRSCPKWKWIGAGNDGETRSPRIARKAMVAPDRERPIQIMWKSKRFAHVRM